MGARGAGVGLGEEWWCRKRHCGWATLQAWLSASDIYVTPYLSEAQITSGTLAYSVGLGKAVVSTPYWHAQELLAERRGTLVPFASSAALAEAIGTLLDDRRLRDEFRRNAYQESGRESGGERVCQ